MVSESDFRGAGDLYELLAFATFQVAMQAKSKGKFEALCTSSANNFRIAECFYEKSGEAGDGSRALRCRAMIEYVGFWCAREVREKMERISMAWRLTKKALRGLQKAGQRMEYGKTLNWLAVSVGFVSAYEKKNLNMKMVIEDALEHGEQAIRLLRGCSNRSELARAYVVTAFFLEWFGHFFLDSDGRETYSRKSSAYMTRAAELSEKTAFTQILECVPLSPLEFWGVGTERALECLKKALKFGRQTRSRLIIGSAFDWLAFNAYWKACMAESTEDMMESITKALGFAEEAKKQYAPLGYTSPRGYSFCLLVAEASSCLKIATCEVNMLKRRDLLEEAVRMARRGVLEAVRSGFPGLLWITESVLSNSLSSLAKMETDVRKRRSLLEEALVRANDVVRLIEQRMPLHYYDLGTMLDYAAGIRYELAQLASDPGSRKRMLKEALADKEHSLALIVKYVEYFERVGSPPLVARTSDMQSEEGDMLECLYELTKDKELLRKMSEVYLSAAQRYQRLGLASRAAETFWKNARVFDSLDEHLRAAESFSQASRSYLTAGKRIPKLTDFYQDQALYMQAWSEIEKARHGHRSQDYDSASEHFEKAGQMHRSLKQWSYLSPNYQAWAYLERAEELSGKGRSQEAIPAFREAAALFEQTSKSVGEALGTVNRADEKAAVTEVIKVCGPRRQYCLARIAVEEARMLERKGEYGLSAAKFDSAARAFEGIARVLESDKDAEEFRFIIDICRGWQQMMLAEEKILPELYVEAAQFFERASKNGPSKASRFLALGNGYFCRALQAGMKFIDTKEVEVYSRSMELLQSAKRYYSLAGVDDMAEYSKATGLLFDAYAHLSSAEKEADPERRAKLYRVTQAVLQSSCGCYIKAKHPEKREQALKLLEIVKEEQAMALSMAELLRAPPLVSTAAFPAPTPTSERAAGSSRFERADVQVHLTAPEEAIAGERLNVSFDAINVGRKSALLIRVANLIPKGAKASVLHPQIPVEDGSLDLKGKMLEPLKVETIRLCIQPNEPGVVELTPQLVFVDHDGEFRTCKPQSLLINVGPKLRFELKTEASEKTLNFLTEAFRGDYLVHEIPLDRSGWRTLMEIVRQAKVPKSSVYCTSGKTGYALSELQRSGIVETRVFAGERGRGGNILKARVFYEKEIVRRYVDSRIVSSLEEPVLCVFHFLADSFLDDSSRRKLSSESCGWRTLVDIIGQVRVTKSSLYGDGEGLGPMVFRLQRTGLVETKEFPGERGRGGRILKMRVRHEKEVVKHYIETRCE